MPFIETWCLQLTYMSVLYKMQTFIKLVNTWLTEILYMYVIITDNNSNCNKEDTSHLFCFSFAGHVGQTFSHLSFTPGPCMSILFLYNNL